jgi:hypothetical protein
MFKIVYGDCMKKRKLLKKLLRQQKREVKILHDTIIRLINYVDDAAEDAGGRPHIPIEEPGKHPIIPLEPEYTKFYQ